VTEPPTRAPRRIAIAGVSGVGKTTLAVEVARRLGIPHIEIDALHHGPNWTPWPEFVADVEAFTAGEAWVTEWQYATARDLVASRADLLVWLDLPYAITLARVVRRTVRRRVRREVLWNGNVEGPLHTFFTDPEHIVRWSISTRRKYRELVPAAAAAHPHLTVVRLRSRREVADWLSRLG